MSLIWKGSWREDPREFMNWIFHHGNPIDFDCLIVSTEISSFISILPEFRRTSTVTRMRHCGESMFYYGDLLGKSVWRDMDAETDYGELVDHQCGRTIIFKVDMEKT